MRFGECRSYHLIVYIITLWQRNFKKICVQKWKQTILPTSNPQLYDSIHRKSLQTHIASIYLECDQLLWIFNTSENCGVEFYSQGRDKKTTWGIVKRGTSIIYEAVYFFVFIEFIYFLGFWIYKIKIRLMQQKNKFCTSKPNLNSFYEHRKNKRFELFINGKRCVDFPRCTISLTLAW